MKLGSNSDYTIGRVNRNASRRLKGRGRGETREQQQRIARQREAQRRSAIAKAQADEDLRRRIAKSQKEELKISAVTEVKRKEVDKNLDGTPVTQKQKVVNEKPFVEPVVTPSVVVGRTPTKGSKTAVVDDIATAQGRKLEATKQNKVKEVGKPVIAQPIIRTPLPKTVPVAKTEPATLSTSNNVQTKLDAVPFVEPTPEPPSVPVVQPIVQPISRAEPDMVETTLITNEDPLDDNVSSITRPTQPSTNNAYGLETTSPKSLKKYVPVLLFYGALYLVLKQGRFI
tara:strand:- start:1831 stop:2685 length:855 start_codon:yes stop_codon:yes gene_type:complete